MTSIDEQDAEREAVLRPGLAALAGVFCLGYVYVGRIWIEFALLLVIGGILAFAAWTRLIVEPLGFLALIAVLFGTVILRIAHPAWIAHRSKRAPERVYRRWWFYLLWIVGVSVCFDLLFSNRAEVLGYENYRVTYPSMVPTLRPGDVIISDAWAFHDSAPSSGDVVVYRPPFSDEIEYIGRIVAVPGQTAEFRQGEMYVDGEKTEFGLPSKASPSTRIHLPVDLGADQYFLLADARDSAADSRIFGPVSRERISSQVTGVIYSTSRRSTFPRRIATAPD